MRYAEEKNVDNDVVKMKLFLFSLRDSAKNQFSYSPRNSIDSWNKCKDVFITKYFSPTKIISITKGKKGNPGKIQGSIENNSVIGKVSKNTEFGIFGTLNNTGILNINVEDAMEVASREEIKEGKAAILCMLEDGKKQAYEIEIQKIYRNNNENNKSMLIKVTDKELLEKTGGIIQGMSGSPIIQNGKVIGALTHVLVNDPQTGYGVFADLMIKQAKEIQ